MAFFRFMKVLPMTSIKDVGLIIVKKKEIFLCDIRDENSDEITTILKSETPVRMKVRINENYNPEFIFESPFCLEKERNVLVIEEHPAVFQKALLYKQIIDFISFVAELHTTRLTKTKAY